MQKSKGRGSIMYLYYIRPNCDMELIYKRLAENERLTLYSRLRIKGARQPLRNLPNIIMKIPGND